MMMLSGKTAASKVLSSRKMSVTSERHHVHQCNAFNCNPLSTFDCNPLSTFNCNPLSSAVNSIFQLHTEAINTASNIAFLSSVPVQIQLDLMCHLFLHKLGTSRLQSNQPHCSALSNRPSHLFRPVSLEELNRLQNWKIITKEIQTECSFKRIRVEAKLSFFGLDILFCTLLLFVEQYFFTPFKAEFLFYNHHHFWKIGSLEVQNVC